MTTFLRLIDRCSLAALWAAKALFVTMVATMMYEIAARYLFGAPTMWAFDVTYMVNGSLFALAAGYTLMVKGHIRIDFLSTSLPAQTQAIIEVAFCVGLLWPALGVLVYVAASETWNAFATGQVEPASPWRPLIWPFYATGALGLAGLLLQSVAETLRIGLRALAPASQ